MNIELCNESSSLCEENKMGSVHVNQNLKWLTCIGLGLTIRGPGIGWRYPIGWCCMAGWCCCCSYLRFRFKKYMCFSSGDMVEIWFFCSGVSRSNQLCRYILCCCCCCWAPGCTAPLACTIILALMDCCIIGLCWMEGCGWMDGGRGAIGWGILVRVSLLIFIILIVFRISVFFSPMPCAAFLSSCEVLLLSLFSGTDELTVPSAPLAACWPTAMVWLWSNPVGVVDAACEMHTKYGEAVMCSISLWWVWNLTILRCSTNLRGFLFVRMAPNQDSCSGPECLVPSIISHGDISLVSWTLSPFK